MLAHLPGESPPVHPAFLPFLFELATLRVFRVFWPMPDRYCGLSSGAEAGVMVGTSSLEHADLLAHHVAYASTIGRLSTRWRVALAPHMAGAAATTISIEPTVSHLGPEALAHDLGALADGLAASVLRLARVRLFCLRRASDERTPVELSGREREVLDLFLAGLSAASIAQRLFISLHTARNHLKHVNAKLGVASQRELRELFATSME